LPLLPDGERGEQDAGLIVVEDDGAGDIAQGPALRLGEDVQPRRDDPGLGRDAPQRQRAAEIRAVLSRHERRWRRWHRWTRAWCCPVTVTRSAAPSPMPLHRPGTPHPDPAFFQGS
jgi:hypothetical protein